jgi:plastocyanin
MQFRPLVAAAATLLLLAACAGTSATTAPTVESPVEASPAATVEATEAATAEASAPAAGDACEPSSAAGEVDVAIADFAFNPAEIQATVGQTVTFTNNDSAPHTATLDDGSCTTPNLSEGSSGGLTFNAAGTYPFHCNVHPDMKGTITIS